MTTISARDIFYSYPKLPVDAPMPMYVEVGEYEALMAELKNTWQYLRIAATACDNDSELQQEIWKVMDRINKLPATKAVLGE